MPIDVEALLAYALLELCDRKPLEKITVTELLNETGTSRRTFYSRFRDKNDLICWIYQRKIVDASMADAPELCFLESERYFDLLRRYQSFIIRACKIAGQNCQQEYMYQTAADYLLEQARKASRTGLLSETA